MHLLSLSLALVALLPTAPALAVPLQPRSAPYASLLGLTTTTRDTSTTDPRHPTKYFHESTSHPHYDGRFTTTLLPRATRIFHMKLLLRAYTAAMERAGVRTWAMHGSLLAWWWSGALFPWDSDLDFCVTEEGGRELGGWWNMSVVAVGARELGLDVSPSGHAAGGGREAAGGSRAVELIPQPPDLQPGVWDKVVAEGKKYLLEVNPHAFSPAPADRYNAIDARWIDTATGLFIDITIVHRVPPAKFPKASVFSTEEPEEQMYTKDTHLYTTASLFPLRRARFEGVDVWVPYAHEQVLIEEYGPRALVETGFDGWVFEGGRWVQGAESGAVGGGGGGGGEGTVKGGFGRPERTDSEARERGRVDNGGAEVYQPRPGRAGDVHVVPGVS